MARLVLVAFYLASTLLLAVPPLATQAQTTVRPYKFGFNIPEQQHRSEMRDEKGIVMGQFGFITADGIYHVTVYATDEEGKFRILAMKSYPYEYPPKTLDMIVTNRAKPPPPAIAVAKAAIVPVLGAKKSPPKHNFHQEACSGCFLRSSPPKVEPKSNIRPLSQSLPGSKDAAAAGRAANRNVAAGGQQPSVPTGGQKPSAPTGGQQPSASTGKASSATAASAGRQPSQGKPQPAPSGRSAPQVPSATKVTQPVRVSVDPKIDLRIGGAVPGTKSPPRSDVNTVPAHATKPATSSSSSVQKTSVTAAKTVGGNAPSPSVKSKILPAKSSSGSRSGATGKRIDSNAGGRVGGFSGGGASASASGGGGGGGGGGARGATGDLYRFKSVLDYNGHSETGAYNGNKEGNYFAIGDDNIQRTIEYVANEHGYQPRIHWLKVDAPKSKENTLKEYEFVWFNKE